MIDETSIVSSMRTMIQGWGRGRIFFLTDFACLEAPVSVRKFISEMAEEGFVARLARGIYCYPRLVDNGYTARMALPEAEEIAYALSETENIRILPYGDEAAYRLGLTSMRMGNLRYRTDGSHRVINLSNGRKIYFNHTSEMKMFAYRNETMRLLATAIRDLGEEYVCTDEKTRIIRRHLRQVPEQDYMRDIVLPPAWVREIIERIWNG